jgi:hypothetical protein
MIKSIELDPLGSRLPSEHGTIGDSQLAANASILVLAPETRFLSARTATELRSSFQSLRRADA